MKVFLGGTCDESEWRERLIPRLTTDVKWFNPVMPDKTPVCMAEQLRQRKTCDYILYLITPKMTGVYSIAEVVDDSNKQPEKTLFCVLPEDEGWEFTTQQLKSLETVQKLIVRNGGVYFESIHAIAVYLNYTEKHSKTKG